MKITMLGTSHGVPEGDRRCACNLVEIEDRRYFVDMGTQAIEDIRSAPVLHKTVCEIEEMETVVRNFLK